MPRIRHEFPKFSWRCTDVHLLTMLEARIAHIHKSTYIYIHNKLNIMSYNSVCMELLRSLLFTLYIHSLCASRRVELARRQ